MLYKERFTWIPLSLRKASTLPGVNFEEPVGQNYSGYYRPKSNIITSVGEDPVTLIHEFIHFQQEKRIGSFPKYNYHFGNWEDGYDLGIKKYFLLNWWEFEALYYQYKLFPKDEGTEYWVKHCIGNNIFNNIIGRLL